MKGRSFPERRAGRVSPALPPDLEVISGRNAVLEALHAGKRVRRLLIAEGLRQDEMIQEATRLARGLGIWPEEVGRDRLDLLAPENQGMALVAAPFQYAGWGELLDRVKRAERAPAVLLLDTLQDPQNLGSLLRTAEAVQVDGVVLPKRRSVHITPAVVRSSAGAVEHLAVAQVPNLVRAAIELKEAGLWIAGIDMEGDRLYWDLDMTGPTALVLGSEDRGIARLLKKSCDFLIRLPMKGRVSSLNAAVAGSVVLYEMLRQRGA